MSLLRNLYYEIEVNELTTTYEIIDTIENYFNRQTDKECIKTSIINRYGVGLEAVKDPADSDELVEQYTIGAFETQVIGGQIEAITSGFGPKIVNALATLFTEETQKYQILLDNGDRAETAENTLWRHRDAGSYEANIVKADRKAVRHGSAAVFLSYSCGHVTYQSLTPSELQVFHSDWLIDEGEKRAVDKSSLEEATCVLIRLGVYENDLYEYLAIYGRNADYPQGRYVTFHDRVGVTQVPSVDSDGKNGQVEWRTPDGKIGNPLSVWANMHPDDNLPEYPIAILYGGTTDSSDIMPWTSSLYTDCLELDTAASHLLSTSQDAARGTLNLQLTHEGQGKPLPKNLTGIVVTQAGQTIEHIQHDAQASVYSLEVLKELAVTIAGGYGVPEYMVIKESSSSRLQDASSGIALEIKSRQWFQNRDHRIRLNKASVEKHFNIERALIGYFDPKDPGIAELMVSKQRWDPGIILLPENKKEKMERIDLAAKDGILDEIGKLQEYYNLASEQEAIEIYEKMKARAKKYPPLMQAQPMPPKKTLGLIGRTRQMQPGQNPAGTVDDGNRS